MLRDVVAATRSVMLVYSEREKELIEKIEKNIKLLGRHHSILMDYRLETTRNLVKIPQGYPSLDYERLPPPPPQVYISMSRDDLPRELRRALQISDDWFVPPVELKYCLEDGRRGKQKCPVRTSDADDDHIVSLFANPRNIKIYDDDKEMREINSIIARVAEACHAEFTINFTGSLVESLDGERISNGSLPPQKGPNQDQDQEHDHEYYEEELIDVPYYSYQRQLEQHLDEDPHPPNYYYQHRQGSFYENGYGNGSPTTNGLGYERLNTFISKAGTVAATPTATTSPHPPAGPATTAN
ncbi:hypothetical protein EV182_002256 [Spiromyces aspiralis]|uniref:Uncharacterized protein n=1 Tax=Spiromyces aspiralis TaxID=68401 RepID=A0ACC1HY59_9FUNG|nr:hypothetical protein EV182_002256 [Spiromyces aspiralis]